MISPQLQPDGYFSATQQKQLAQLMTNWRAQRDQGNALPAHEQQALEALVTAELSAATARTNQRCNDQPPSVGDD